VHSTFRFVRLFFLGEGGGELSRDVNFETLFLPGSFHKREKPQAPTPQSPTPQAPIRNRQTRKVENAKGLNRHTNLT